jgi:hypothetical protein
MLLAGTVTMSELIAAAVAATLGLVATSIVAVQLEEPVAVDATWLPELRQLPPRVVRDWGDLVRALWSLLRRRPTGSAFRSFDYKRPPAGRRARSREALTIFAGSTAPNSYVISVHVDRQCVMTHMLVDRPVSPLPRVAQGIRAEGQGL